MPELLLCDLDRHSQRWFAAAAGEPRPLGRRTMKRERQTRTGLWGSILVVASGCAVTHRHAPEVAENRPVKVGSILHGDEPVTKVQPVLPPEATARGIVGPVVLEIRISETGDVSVISVVRGHALLDELATSAVVQWKYRPVVINESAVPVIKVVAVSFVARDDPNAARQEHPK